MFISPLYFVHAYHYCLLMIQGRGGKGNIYVFAVGNGGSFNGTCSYEDYVTSIYTIGISVVTGRNVPSRQNIKCAAISAVTYARDNSMGIHYPHDLMVCLFVHSIKPDKSIMLLLLLLLLLLLFSLYLYVQKTSYQDKIKRFFDTLVTSISTFINV